eukprot:scaffold93909_cov54-Phaeocystis_antarctica.AAC.5
MHGCTCSRLISLLANSSWRRSECASAAWLEAGWHGETDEEEVQRGVGGLRVATGALSQQPRLRRLSQPLLLRLQRGVAGGLLRVQRRAALVLRGRAQPRDAVRSHCRAARAARDLELSGATGARRDRRRRRRRHRRRRHDDGREDAVGSAGGRGRAPRRRARGGQARRLVGGQLLGQLLGRAAGQCLLRG